MNTTIKVFVQVFDICTGRKVYGKEWDGSLKDMAAIVNTSYHKVNRFDNWGDDLTIHWLEEYFTGDDFILDGLKYHIIPIEVENDKIIRPYFKRI